jgi:hypothetical protein
MNLLNYPGSEKWGGFAGRENEWHKAQIQYPWWFAGACKKSDPVWNDLPTIDGHGIIDMWLCRYRADRKFVDVVPFEVLCCHQPHQTSAIAPEGEQVSLVINK